ncbi:ATP-dependent DNA ligase [Agromyces sp. NPDC056523]|uniref:DUF7882 family protein n=1 Tax=Agromyces sp. NPDC056523 TaxID=3345850 RepID=UPI0036718696
MGTLIYGPRISEFEIEDRTLAHLQFVIAAKLQRGENFMFTWSHGMERGSGRSVIWISPAAQVHFRFSGNRAPTLNRAWLEILMDSANSRAGLHWVPEPTEAVRG